jgi:hypothetical protein
MRIKITEGSGTAKRHSGQGGLLTARYKIRKSICRICFAGDIKVHRSTRLVIRRIKEVSLLECSIYVRRIPCTVWEMIYLHVQLDQASEEGHILQTGMSMVCAGYGRTISLPPSRSFWSFARLTFGINALARPIDAANKLGSPIVYLIVH